MPALTTPEPVDTPHGTAQARRRRAVGGVVAVGLVVLLTGCLAAPQQTMLDDVNRDRQAQGRTVLPTQSEVMAKAQAWSAQMARDGKISHSQLSDGIKACWDASGENVAQSTTLAGLEAQWMASPSHRTNILDQRWTHIGVGVTKVGDWYFGVQVFLQVC